MKKIKYFGEYQEMYDFIQKNKITPINYTFTFAYGYKLIYLEV